MTLEDRLTELVTARGADVLADPVEFRAALDDYVTDEEITPGDRNVLVDAVRLGAVQLLLRLLDQGSEPRAAISEAGMALARERGSDDARRSLHATALLGYAAGRVDSVVLRSFEVSAPPVTLPPPPAPPRTAVLPRDPSVPTRRRGRVAWVVGVVVLLLAAGAFGWWWLVLRAESPEEGVEKWFAARSCEAVADRVTGPAEEFIDAEMSYGDDSSFCTSFPDYASEYDVESVDERGDRATVEVDGTQHYDGSDESIADERDFTATFDLRRVEDAWLVSNVEWTYDDEE